MFWDSSAILPILIQESTTERLSALLQEESDMALWWGTPVECASALYRRHRQSTLPSPELRRAFVRLDSLVADVDVVAPSDAVRRRTRRLLATHPLRAADALQLAAALSWCNDDAGDETFLSLDERLREAAAREGFAILPDQARPLRTAGRRRS